MSYGLLPQGFKPKTFQQIKDDIENDLLKNIDSSLRFSHDTVAGQISAIVAYEARKVWETLSGLYVSLDANSADNKALDSLCFLTGSIRKKASKSKTLILITLAPKTKIPKGLLLCAKNNTQALFETIEEIHNELDNEHTFEVEVYAKEEGPLFVEEHKLTQVVTPYAGLLSVTNPKEVVLGSLKETDEQLRLRRVEELRSLGAATYEALQAQILKIKDVEDVFIKENEMSFSAFILGGNEQEICETIFKYKPIGVPSDGDISQLVMSQNGQKHLISFSRPCVIHLKLELKLKVTKSFSDGDTSTLKLKILEYAKNHFKMGNMPYLAKLYPLIFEQSKILDISFIKLKKISSEEELNAILPFEITRFSSDTILIEQQVEGTPDAF